MRPRHRIAAHFIFLALAGALVTAAFAHPENDEKARREAAQAARDQVERIDQQRNTQHDRWVEQQRYMRDLVKPAPQPLDVPIYNPHPFR